MEALLANERELEIQIDTYKTQLSGVESQLGGGGEEIKQLHDDLSQLISLTEESLVELKKQRLLLMLHPTEEEGRGMDGYGQQTSSKLEDAEETEGEGSGEIVGMKCRAPLKESWGAVNYHNAMVLCVEHQMQTGSEQQDSEAKVRVLFTQPLYSGMRPCPFFMEGSCKFSEEDCKFSHGLVVSISELQPYQDHDFHLAHVGGKCLAKHSDDLWHPAVIRSIGEDQVTVHYTDLRKQAEVEFSNIYPIASSDDSDSVSSESEASAADEEGEEEEEMEGDVRVLGWQPKGAKRPLGEWEKHTTGFGSKLLAKMGYVSGQGLGKSSQGRVEPVEIVVLPPGKSLDVCAEMRERKKLRGVDTERQRKRRRRKERAAEIKAANEEQKMDMFDFLNTKVFNKMNSDKEVENPRSVSKATGKSENLNVRLFKVQEEIKTAKKRRMSLQQTLKRHQGKNKQMEAHVMEKLHSVEKQLNQLQREEQMIEKNIASKTERRKLSVF